MERWIEKWADHLIENGADPKNKDVIIYGIEGAVSEILANIAVFTIAFLIGKPLEMLIWQIFWLPLRVNIGGHHAKHHITCLVYSTALAVGCVLILPYILNWAWLLIVEITITIIVSFFFAPYVHPNRPASDQHIQKIKKRGKLIAGIECFLIILFYFLLPIWVSYVAALGMFAATTLCIIGFLDQALSGGKS
ncbi:MAG: accessory gene regulator B family protein [Eubacterium sp.]